MLISIETHITCDFQAGEGSGPPIPPLDLHMELHLISLFVTYNVHSNVRMVTC